MSKRLNGYWTSKENPRIYLFVDKVFKKGYVIAHMYERTEPGEIIHPTLRLSHEDLQANYERGLSKP